MTAEHSTKLPKNTAQGVINGPIFVKVTESHGRTMITLPKPFVRYHNIAADWSAFRISICERGFLLELVPKHSQEFNTKQEIEAGGTVQVSSFHPACPDVGIITNSNNQAKSFARISSISTCSDAAPGSQGLERRREEALL